MDVIEPRVLIHNLPDELLLEILQYMDAEELVTSISKVCIRWKNVANTSHLWKNLFYKPQHVQSDEDIISMLKCMPQLRIFIFNPRCFKVDEIIDVLCSNCKYLHTVICDSVVVTSNHLKKLNSHLPNIQCFQLSQWQMMDDTSLHILGKFQNLKKLTCVNIGPASTYIHSDKNFFQALEQIEMKAYCTGDVLMYEDQRTVWDSFHFLHLVPHFTNLKHLSIDFRMLHFSGFQSVFKNMKKLQKLETLCFRSLFHSDEDILSRMFEYCYFPKIWKLDLSNCLHLNAKTVQSICLSCPIVEELHFGRCIYFDDDCAQALVKFPELHCLDVSCCNRISEKGLATLAQCPKLEILDLSWRHVIPNHTLAVISTLPYLKGLILNHTQINHEDIMYFLSNCRHVVYLGLYSCKGVDEEIIKNTIPHCKVNCNLMEDVLSPLTKILGINKNK